jgi:hypothetical protein
MNLDLLSMDPLSQMLSEELVVMEDGKTIELVGKEYLLGTPLLVLYMKCDKM